jgi:hypothetical protein
MLRGARELVATTRETVAVIHAVLIKSGSF